MSVSPPGDSQESSSRYFIEKQNILEKISSDLATLVGVSFRVSVRVSAVPD